MGQCIIAVNYYRIDRSFSGSQKLKQKVNPSYKPVLWLFCSGTIIHCQSRDCMYAKKFHWQLTRIKGSSNKEFPITFFSISLTKCRVEAIGEE